MTSDIVAREWQRLLGYGGDAVDPAMVRAAYAQPRLRELYPGVSHGIMFFKQGDGLSGDPVGGYVYPQEDGRFWVRGPLGVGSLGEVDTLEEAFSLVVASLPQDSGSAITEEL